MRIYSAIAIVVMLSVGAQAAVVMETVSVGNAGNAGVVSGFGDTSSIVGGVSYEYEIGKFEVTAGQYSEFLNAVAKTDTFGLYNELMWSTSSGARIEVAGDVGNYSYSVASDAINRPVNFVSWGDAARFANWMHNGQPTGGQDLGTTEDGSYYLNGAVSDADLLAVARKPDATWVIPSEDEWYKAAYHKNDGVTGNYFTFPTSSDAVPSNDLIDPDPGNNATFYVHPGDYTIGNPYMRTEVGAHENSDSPYGTFDQGGNEREWNEAILFGSGRMTRGGWANDGAASMSSLFRQASESPSSEYVSIGFRVGLVPEPGTLVLLVFGGFRLMRRR